MQFAHSTLLGLHERPHHDASKRRIGKKARTESGAVEFTIEQEKPLTRRQLILSDLFDDRQRKGPMKPPSDEEILRKRMPMRKITLVVHRGTVAQNLFCALGA